jgi:Holliday junction DNA helicase RuvA
MIARLKGTLVEKQVSGCVVDVGGVGYHLSVPLSTLEILGEPGEAVELHVHTHVREDALLLFGFGSRLEKELFVRLIGVNGIGPRTALALLSGLGADDLIQAVRDRDAGRLASIPGIGRKTAERILVDLADRLAAIEAAGAAGGSLGRPAGSAGLRQDLVSALVNLGYNARTASEAADLTLKSPGGTAPRFEALLRDTLKFLSR